MRKLLIIQALLVMVATVVSWFYLGESAVLPALYGGSIALANAMLLTRRLAIVQKAAETSPQQSINAIYIGAIQRFVFVLVALGFGIGLLSLDPIPLLATFMVAQLAFLMLGNYRVN